MLSITTLLQIVSNYNYSFNSSIPTAKDSWGASEYIAVAACIISALTIIASYYTIYVQNQHQIKFAAFERLAIQNISKILEPIDNIFDNKANELLSLHINEITEVLGDVEIFLIEFKDIYTGLEIIKIIKIKDDFSNPIYSQQSNQIKLFRAQYFAFKSRLLYELYLFAMAED
jgi:hypothetical protein